MSTAAARYQDISLNPQKLAGQCAKLKCCLNYEVDCYVEASRGMPSREIDLETKDGTFYFFKADILRGELTYSTDKHLAANLVTITAKRANAIIEMNKRGERPETLSLSPAEEKRSADLLEQENIARFDNTGKKRHRKGGGRNNAEQADESRPQQHRREGASRGERRQPKGGAPEGGNRGERRPRRHRENNGENGKVNE